MAQTNTSQIGILQTISFIYNVYFHPLSAYPGPLLYRGSDIPKLFQLISGNDITWTHQLHEKYGSVVRIAPSELSYISAQAWKEIHTSHKGIDPLPLNPMYGQVEMDHFGAYSTLWQVNLAEHARHRNVLTPAFSNKSLKEQVPIISKYVNLLVQRMRENAGKTIDLCAWFHFATFDIIGDLAFGEPFDCLEESKFHPWIHFIITRLRMMLYGQVIMGMGIIGVIAKKLMPQRIKDDIAWHVALTIEKVNRRRKAKTGRQDFMTHILPKVEQPDGLSVGELYANAQILVMAGSETSATLLAVMAYYLMKNPDKLRRLQAEVRTAFASEAEIDFATVSKLPYLVAVISESLRIQPPIPLSIPRFVPHPGATIDGRFVPGGTNLAISQFAAYRSRSNFRDPDRFVPERWLGEERYADDNRDVFQPFSLGPRNCIGRHLAQVETRLILARLVWNFDFELMPDSEAWHVQRTFLLYEKGPLHARLTPVRRESVQVPSIVVEEKAV